jgi:hypothetical protein
MSADAGSRRFVKLFIIQQQNGGMGKIVIF